MWPCGVALNGLLTPMCGDREKGSLLLSHIYLLLGLSVPLWISPTHTGGELVSMH